MEPPLNLLTFKVAEVSASFFFSIRKKNVGICQSIVLSKAIMDSRIVPTVFIKDHDDEKITSNKPS